MTSKSTIDLAGYDFTQFSGSLEDLNQTHPYQIRRTPETTYFDEFAKAELIDLHPAYYDQHIEGWSRSYYEKDKHLNSVLEYAIPDTPIETVNEPVYIQGVNAVRMELASLPRVRAYSVIDELDLVKFESTSSAGYGYIGPKGDIGGENHDRAIRHAKAILYSATAPDGEGIDYAIRESNPDIGYTRTQLVEIASGLKVRSVWGRAFHYILLEGTSVRPILEAFQEADTFYQIGSDPTISVPRKLGQLSAQFRWLYSIDWSKFDATVSTFEIHTAFDILKEIITFPDFDTEQAFELSRQLFIHKKICAPDGKVYWSHKGIPSGSYFTSVIGSIVNRLRVEYLWRLRFHRGPGRCYTQGDDSLIGDNDYYNPSDMQEHAATLGWRLNAAKTAVSRMANDITFLGRKTTGGLNARDLKRCVRLLILPEFPVESGSISAYRAQSIYEDSGQRSKLLADIAMRLKRRYGIAQEEDVPLYFKRYIP